jgi:serine/threonine protein kinase
VQKEALVSQMVLMQYAESHPHVLKLLGCCTTDDRVALVVEYCALGNLREFLTRNRRKFQVAIHGP